MGMPKTRGCPYHCDTGLLPQKGKRDLNGEQSCTVSSSSRNPFFNRLQILICQTYRTTELCGKKAEKFDPGIYNSVHYPV